MKRTTSGIGLGLTISKWIIDSFNGNLVLETTSWDGTVFSFSIKVNSIEEFSDLEKVDSEEILSLPYDPKQIFQKINH